MLILYVALHVVTNYYSDFFRRKTWEELFSILEEEAVFYVLLVIVYFLIHQANTLSRLMTVYLVLLQTVLMFVFRTLFKRYMMTGYRMGRFSRRMILITKASEADTLIRRLKSGKDWSSQICGVILLDMEDQEKEEKGEEIDGIEVAVEIEVSALVVDVRDAAGHAGREVYAD